MGQNDKRAAALPRLFPRHLKRKKRYRLSLGISLVHLRALLSWICASTQTVRAIPAYTLCAQLRATHFPKRIATVSCCLSATLMIPDLLLLLGYFSSDTSPECDPSVPIPRLSSIVREHANQQEYQDAMVAPNEGSACINPQVAFDFESPRTFCKRSSKQHLQQSIDSLLDISADERARIERDKRHKEFANNLKKCVLLLLERRNEHSDRKWQILGWWGACSQLAGSDTSASLVRERAIECVCVPCR